jgi:hypothetical protein
MLTVDKYWPLTRPQLTGGPKRLGLEAGAQGMVRREARAGINSNGGHCLTGQLRDPSRKTQMILTFQPAMAWGSVTSISYFGCRQMCWRLQERLSVRRF